MIELEVALITIAKNTKGRLTERWISLSLLAALTLFTLIFTYVTRVPTPPRIAILDTAFCPDFHSEFLAPKVELELIQNLETAKTICSLPINHPMRHGDRVLQTYLKNLSPDVAPHQIRLYGLFTLSGAIDGKSWLRGATDAMMRGSDLIASAVGAPVAELRSEILALKNELLLISSGQWGGRVQEAQKFIPQEMIRKSSELRKKSLVIGSYFLDGKHQEAFLDNTLLYTDLIDYSFAVSEDEEGLTGSSYALAVASARLMNFCASEVGDPADLKECLRHKSVSVKTVNGPTLYQY